MSSLFQPTFTPVEMLELGVFNGTYYSEYSDFQEKPEVRTKNLFAPNVSSSKELWIKNGWITPEDPLGWFQWYVRYSQGRRIEAIDKFQMSRWRSFVARHGAQVLKNGNGDITKRLRQRQCLLHWGADPIPDVQAADKKAFLVQNFIQN
jgi:hypothetical protein